LENFTWIGLWSFFSGLGGVGAALVAFIALKQLKEMKRSIDDAKQWNKLNSAFTYLPKSHEFIELEKDLNNSFIALIDRNTPLKREEVDKLFDGEHKELRVKLKSYLNMLESFCTAIEMGAVDEDAAKAMYSHKFKRHYQEMEPYIKHMQATQNDSDIYCSLKNVVSSWSEQRPVFKKY
jgi:hypothetical protein